MFPPGWPGFGLLLLRFSVAIALLAEACAHRQGLPDWLLGADGLLAASLRAGYLTSGAAVLGLLLHLLIWFRLGSGSAVLATGVLLETTALALLGSGQYSVDA